MEQLPQQTANVVTKYTCYYINTPNFLIKYIQNELALRDIPGLTNNIIGGVRVTGTHPLVKLTGAMLSTGGGNPNFSGILPAVAVIETNEVEEVGTFNYGERSPFVIDQQWVTEFKVSHSDVKKRMEDGLLTDKQLLLIENAVSTNPVIALKKQIWLNESNIISVWCETLSDRQIIGDLVKSIVFDMRSAMRDKGIRDISVKIDNGLVNMNFGRTIHGMEISIDFTNTLENIIVTDEIPLDDRLTDDFIEVYDPITKEKIIIPCSLDIDISAKSVGGVPVKTNSI